MASITVRFPSALRAKAGGIAKLPLEADTIREALRNLDSRLPQLAPVLRNEGGVIRPGIQVYVNDQHVRLRRGLDTPLSDGDVVLIVPTVMGG